MAAKLTEAQRRVLQDAAKIHGGRVCAPVGLRGAALAGLVRRLSDLGLVERTDQQRLVLTRAGRAALAAKGGA